MLSNLTPQRMSEIAELTKNSFWRNNKGWTDEEVLEMLQAYDLVVPFIQKLDGFHLADIELVRQRQSVRHIALMRGLQW